VAWTAVAWQTSDAWRVLEPPQLYVETFDVFDHLRVNGTPICGVAVPVECFRDEGLMFREDLPVFEDWDMVLQVAQLRAFQSTGRLTALYRRGSPDSSGASHAPAEWEEAERRITQALDEGGFVLRGEYLASLRRDLDELDQRRRGEWSEPDPPEPDDPSSAFSQPPDVQPASSTGPRPSWSLVDRDVLIVSAHLDDAVLSCGNLIGQLSRCEVLTVFAGEGADWSELTVWDEASGFEPGTNVVEARIAEDDAALGLLGASGTRLPFLDSQYREPWISPPVDELAMELAEAIARSRPEVVLFPLGIGHEDHRLASLAAAAVVRSEPTIQWVAYQDLPYAQEMGGVEEALERLADLAPLPVELGDGSDVDRKGPALDRYVSQTAALGERRRAIAVQGPERYWLITPAGGEDSQRSPG
jgi:LmbE family N-acetylglucosaminyl deacetylase